MGPGMPAMLRMRCTRPFTACSLLTARGMDYTRDPQLLVDGFARRMSYLRISLTDRCNYRCAYCMPADEQLCSHVLHEDLLSPVEISELVGALIPVGVRRVRLTGGEPTVRRDLLEIVKRLSALGLEEVTLSTNGERLTELAGPLRAAGLSRLNISVDTLSPERFRRLTRHGELSRVLSGIEAAREAGFHPIKLNTVALGGFNDDEFGALCRYAFARGLIPRFIELMPIGEGVACHLGTYLPASAIRARLAVELGPLCTLPADEAPVPGTGPARYFGALIQGAPRRIGIIAAISEPFCDSCDRVRLSAAGQLHTCLGHDSGLDLAAAMRRAPDDRPSRAAAIVETVRSALKAKHRGHAFTPSGCGRPRRQMIAIGG